MPAETKERPHTPGPLPPDTRKPDSPATGTKSTNETTSATSPMTVPTVATSVAPPSVIPIVISSAAASHPPPLTPNVPPLESVVPHPSESGSTAVTPSDASKQGAEKCDPTKDPHPSKETLKPVVPLESTTARLLESSSTSSLVNSPITTSEDVGSSLSSDPTEVLSQPPASETTAVSLQTGQEKEKAVVLGAGAVQVVGRMSDETHHVPGTNGGKRKTARGKGKMTLTLINVTEDDVVKCMLVTKNELKIKFQFSSKFDETKAIFKKLVSHTL